jgi:hypothetical protein
MRGERVKCGVCGQRYGDLLVKHGQVCEDDIKADRVGYSPEIDDLQKMKEEEEGEMTNQLLDEDWCVEHYTYYPKDTGCETCQYEEESK